MFTIRKKYFSGLFILAMLLLVPVRTITIAGNQTLWKISQNGHHVYILGSVHFLKKENYPLPQKFYKAFDSCQTLVLEADLDSLKMPSTAMKMMQISLLPENKTFKDVVPADTYAATAAHLKNLGLSMQLFPRSKPWFIALTITAMEAQKMGMDANLGLDVHFAERAKTKNLSLVGLEPVAFQMNLFDQLPLQTQIEFLQKTLQEAAESEKTMDEMLAAWESGNEEQLQNLLAEGFEGFPQLQDKLLDARNKKWIPQILEMLNSEKTHFIIVGAGHLVGEEGVIRLLKKNGCEVKKL